MALPQNRSAVVAILETLKADPRILGQKLKASSCGCGAIHLPSATAVEIDPSGDDYPGQESSWLCWSVSMKADDPMHGSDWSTDLTAFIPVEELDELFEKHFGPDLSGYDTSYDLPVHGADRVYRRLPAAVKIRENDNQIRFSIEFGKEQRTARKVQSMYSRLPHRVPRGSEGFDKLVKLLKNLPVEVYRGGPDPELPFESTWHVGGYHNLLTLAAASADHLFFQNGGSTYDHRGSVVTHWDVVFMKHAVR